MTQQEQPPRTDALRAALEQCLDYLYGPKDDCCHCCGAIDHIEPTEQHEKWCVVPPARAALATTPSPSSGLLNISDDALDQIIVNAADAWGTLDQYRTQRVTEVRREFARLQEQER